MEHDVGVRVEERAGRRPHRLDVGAPVVRVDAGTGGSAPARSGQPGARGDRVRGAAQHQGRARDVRQAGQDVVALPRDEAGDQRQRVASQPVADERRQLPDGLAQAVGEQRPTTASGSACGRPSGRRARAPRRDRGRPGPRPRRTGSRRSGPRRWRARGRRPAPPQEAAGVVVHVVPTAGPGAAAAAGRSTVQTSARRTSSRSAGTSVRPDRPSPGTMTPGSPGHAAVVSRRRAVNRRSSTR